jgi:hypothetical protein
MSFVRYLGNGELDPAFLGGGRGGHDLPDNVEDFPGQLLLQPDDGLIVNAESYQGTSFLVLRLTADGALDMSWGDGGIATRVPGKALGTAESGSRLIVVGSAQGGASQSARIARYWLR